jgi:hypothetical protein
MLQGTAIALFGLSLALAPLSAASASTTTTTSHHTTTTHHSTKKNTKNKKKGSSNKKGSNPGSSLCTDLKSEESSSSKLGSTIAAAIESNNYPAAKQDMLNTLNSAEKDAGPALSKLSNAPSNVRNAMKTLISFYNTFKTTIENSTSFEGLTASLAALAKNPQLAADGTTVSNYVTSQCGSILPTTTTPSIPTT